MTYNSSHHPVAKVGLAADGSYTKVVLEAKANNFVTGLRGTSIIIAPPTYKISQNIHEIRNTTLRSLGYCRRGFHRARSNGQHHSHLRGAK
jgi:hypothetical protein